MIRIALAGNPNSGKTTLFNCLTGATAHVGNWPGVTVDKKEGLYKKCEEPISVVDLPGIYSLSPYTPEEVVSRNYILEEKPDCVINIVDATNLERNLYLTTQLMEIDVPIIIALNMMDAVEKRGDKIDAKKLEKKIGLPVVQISALKGQGMDELMQRAYSESKRRREGTTVLCNTALSHLIGDVKISLEGKGVDSPLFHAVKLVESDELEVASHSDCVKMVEAFKTTFKDDIFGTDFEAMVADGRYKYISQNFSPVLTRKEGRSAAALTRSDKADIWLTHRIWGIPIFLAIMFAVFHVTFSENFLYLGNFFPEDWDPLAGTLFEGLMFSGGIFSPGVIIFNIWNDLIVAKLFDFIGAGIVATGMADWAISLINDGIFGGLKSVLSFLPQILTLFLFFSILEDSGYMARVAFILDKLFRKFGLSGRAFMPMIMGFGCSVPAMANTKTLADDNERIATIRVIPFFSCGAKLPILTAVAGAIALAMDVNCADIITYSMYVLGIAVAIVSVLLMRNTTMKGEVPPFIMELPAYHAPQMKSLMMLIWDKAKHFIKKAFTVILASTIVVWFLTNFTWQWKMVQDGAIDQSILASIGGFIQPLFTPLGFGSQLGVYGWVFAVAAITGLIAKEDVIGTMGTLAACLAATITATTVVEVDLDGGVSAVRAMIEATNATTPALIAYIAFNMLTVPCFAAVATAKAELPNKKTFNWTLVFWIAASYVVSMAVYLIGTYWWTAFIFAIVAAVVVCGIVFYNKARRLV